RRRHRDARVPRQAVEQLAHCLPRGVEIRVGNSGVGEVRERQVSGETALLRFDGLQVGEDQPPEVGLTDEGPWARRWTDGSGAGRAPLAQPGHVAGAGSGRLLAGRHLALADALEQLRLVGLAGRDLAQIHEPVAVEDEAEAALGVAVLAVAAVAVFLEDGPG